MGLELLDTEVAAELDAILQAPSALGLLVSGRTRAAQIPLEASFVRFLSAEDVLLEETTELGSKTPALARIRDTHHTLARLLAEGRKQVEISAITGFSQSRISILKNDPAFKELIEFYRTHVNNEYVDVHKRISALALDATMELHDRLLDTPEKITTNTLVEIVKATHDRSGHGPTATTQNLNISMTADELSQMKMEVAKETTGNVHKLTRAALPADRLVIVGGVHDGRPDSTGEGESSGVCEEGTGVREEGR